MLDGEARGIGECTQQPRACMVDEIGTGEADAYAARQHRAQQVNQRVAAQHGVGGGIGAGIGEQPGAAQQLNDGGIWITVWPGGQNDPVTRCTTDF